MADDLRKMEHSNTISVLLCIAHVLPLAGKSVAMLKFIGDKSFEHVRNFHEKWTLDGWNDDVIQPVRDAVLNYYKVCAPISSPTVLVPNPLNRTLFIL